MPTDEDEVTITEISEFEPSRVDGVGKGANGFPILMLKQIDAEKADDRADCKTCNGDGKIRAGHVTCPDCHGSGKAPMVGESAKAYMEFAAATVAAKDVAGSAPSGSGPTPAHACPTCKGMGVLPQDAGTPKEKQCTDCGGTGLDQATTNPKELNAVDAPAGSITEGAGGKETDDGFNDAPIESGVKSADISLDEARDLLGLDKATISAADQNDAPDSAFAFIEKGGKKDSSGKTVPRSLRHFYIGDAAHVRNALARASQSPFGDQAMPAIKAAAKKFGIEVSAEKAAAPVSGSVYSAPNPALADPVSQGTDPATGDYGATATGAPVVGGTTDSDDAVPDVDDSTIPGSPAWEAVDAATATQAALALMTAAELIRTFSQREMQEVVAGEGNDVFDANSASMALCAVQDALGVMAQMAFHEGLEAAKSLPDDETVEKAGRRLAGKTIAALAAARDKAADLANHIGGVLGDDDPKKAKSGIKSAADIDELISKEIDDMTGDELLRLLDERDAQKAAAAAEAEAEKATAQDVDNKDSIAGGKAANSKAKGKDPKADDKDLEDEAEDNDDGTPDSPKGAAKSTEEETVTEDTEVAEKAEAEVAEPVELTPEQIEAKKARKALKKQLREAKEAEKIAAETAALTKALEESKAEAEKAVKALEERLATVEKMAAPSNIVRTAPVEAQNVAKARDETELRIAALQREARETPDPTVRAGNLEMIKELRAGLVSA